MDSGKTFNMLYIALYKTIKGLFESTTEIVTKISIKIGANH